ncbi:EAL domain-containing protein [Aliterella atlantica]|uniref:EAL domain-containing protein n=1 Tax=Aliterella atlantica TaxID=1827278 RepID=UPI0006978C8A|nr:EAL domain-containing protein [Aliterella atlantica]
MKFLAKASKYWERQIPVAIKICLPLLAVTVATATVLTVNASTTIRERLKESHNNQARQLASIIAVEFSSHAEDAASMNIFLEELKKLEPSIHRINIYRIVDSVPKVWASSDRQNLEVDYPLEKHDLEPLITGKSSEEEEDDEQLLEISVPLKVNGRIVAAMGVYIDLAPRDRAIASSTKNIAIATTIGVATQISVLLLILYWAIMRRIARLSRATLLVAAGDLSIHLPEGDWPKGRDEITNVARTFDQMVDAVRERTYQQTTVTKISQTAVVETDLFALMQTAISAIAQTLKVEYASILESLPYSQALLLRAGVGWQQDFVGQATLETATHTQIGYQLINNKQLVIEDLKAETIWSDLGLLQEHQIVSSLNVLIATSQEPYGVLSVHETKSRTFSADEIYFLQAIANVLAIAIERKRAETILVRAQTAETAKQNLEKEVTERLRVETALRESEQRYILAANGANDGLWDWDLKNNRLYFSPRWKSMLGYEQHEIGNSIQEWFNCIHPEDVEGFKSALSKHLQGLTTHFEFEYRIQHKCNSDRWMLSRGLAVQDENGNPYRIAGSQTDITERKLFENQLLHDAFHDSLTGLANRALFIDRLEHRIKLNQRQERLFAVLFLDLDRFKVVNDSLGHIYGDQLLIAFAQILSPCLRSIDTLARLGGDEFAILLEDLNTIGDAIEVANRIQAQLEPPFQLASECQIFTSVSIGIALAKKSDKSAENLLRDADTAMYKAKAQGKARYEVFDPAMHAKALTRLQLENDLRLALDSQELQVHYQPIVAMQTGMITGFEALIRWQHPSYGWVSPVDFIPIAEETGLIVPLGYWILRQACRQLCQWQAKFPTSPPLTVSVNLSPKQFSQLNLIEQIKQILQATGLEAQSLKLEITEGTIVENAEAAAKMLMQLRTLGVKLYIDDFGTGYSSLSYLHRFPFDALKIDRSFVKRISANGENTAIIQTIVTLAHNVGTYIVAEGVETQEQLAQLQKLDTGKGLAQGYLFSKPLDAEAIATLLAQKPIYYPPSVPISHSS